LRNFSALNLQVTNQGGLAMQAQPTMFASIATSQFAGLNARFSRLVTTASLMGKLALGLGLALSLSTQAQTIVPGKIPGSFAVSPSGAATYSIPIQVPPGVAGMEPKLSLEYNSQGGNGIMGMGWNLAGLSSITRCPATMAQDGVRGSVNYDDKDKFCLDGQRLMVVSGAYGAPGSEYRTEIESFSRITAIGQAGAGPASFTVKTKAGLTMEYGIIDGTRDSRIEAQGKSAVMVWAIGKIADVKGNTMTFVYNEDNANGSFLPTSISYAGNVVTFVYDTTQRPDIQTGYQASSKVTLSQRLKSIKTWASGSLVQQTTLNYSVGATLRSLLTSMQVCDWANSCLLSINLSWQGSSIEPALSSALGSDALDAGYQVGRAWIDINGDGMADYCRMVGIGNQIYCALSTGTGFGAAISSGIIDPGYEAGRVWIDVNGDGMADFCRMVGTGNQIACTLSTGTGLEGGFTTGIIDPGYEAGRAWTDVNGDGIVDFCRVIGLNGDGGQVSCSSTSFSRTRISQIQTSINQALNINYSPLTTGSYIKDNGTNKATYPKVDLQMPMQVVSQVDTSNGVGGVNSVQYSYGGLKAEQGTGRGMLGFRWMQSKELATGIESRTEYFQDFPYTGMPIKSETRLAGFGNGGLLKRSTSTPACKIPQIGGAACAAAMPNCNDPQQTASCVQASVKRYFPYTATSKEESWDLNGTTLPVTTSETVYGNDPVSNIFWGDPKTITVTSGDGASKVTTNEYLPADTSNWILGRLKKASVTSTKP
jgi:hypothetical protein